MFFMLHKSLDGGILISEPADADMLVLDLILMGLMLRVMV